MRTTSVKQTDEKTPREERSLPIVPASTEGCTCGCGCPCCSA
ncbi:MAG: hypothetical protein ACE5HJ_02415 [Thermoplasmata archaeon]